MAAKTSKPTARSTRKREARATKTAAPKATAKPKAQPKGLTPCQCRSQIAYRVTAADIPEADPNGFAEFDVHQDCGGETASTFLPGHDAKYKSVLIKAARAGESFHYLSGGVLIDSDPRNLAAERGWERFIDAARADQATKDSARAERAVAAASRKAEKEAAKAARTAEKAAAPKAAKPAKSAAKAPAKPGGFHPVRVRVNRRIVDANLESEDVNSITVTYKIRGNNTTETLPRSALVQ